MFCVLFFDRETIRKFRNKIRKYEKFLETLNWLN